jgi:two-component system, OmpR family, sensor histidine kinase VicK
MTMEAVDKKWYIGYTWWIVINAIIILIIGLVSFVVPAFADNRAAWGIAPTTIVLATVTLLYRFTYYKVHTEMYGLNFATFVLSLIQIANVINLVNLTGWEHSWYLIILYTMLLFSGIVGVYPLLGAALLLSLYVIITFPSLAGDPDAKRISLIVVTGYIFCIISYFLWRNQYIDAESQKVSRLNTVLKSKQKQAEILIESIADGVIVTDTEGRISLMNPTASTMTGWPIQEAVNIGASSVVKLAKDDGKPLEENSDPFKQVFIQQKSVSGTMTLISRDNKQLIVSLVVSPVILPSTKQTVGAVAVIRDISSEKKLEKQRADFISTASHEMRTPVAAIEGYLALAMNPNVSKIDTKAKEYLDKAHSSTQHLGKLFQDLLTSAKAEDGRLSSHPVVIDMGEFVENLADDLRLVAQKKGLKVELLLNSVEENSGVIDASMSGKSLRPIYYSQVDPDRMREVITNLFDNAVKYTEQGKVSLAITGNNDIIQIRVSDTGPGIPADDLPHLFQKFYRVDNSATRTIGGTGLGLFICKKIVELYHGTIWAESTVGKGSTFFINLPRLTREQAEQMKRTEVTQPLS